MLLALILMLNFSCPLSEENAVGVRFQSHTEYKIIVVIKGLPTILGTFWSHSLGKPWENGIFLPFSLNIPPVPP